MDDCGIVPTNRLWTPWRMAYVSGGSPSSDCVFCRAETDHDDASNLVLYRGNHCFVIMNLYPYNTGHLMVVPNNHVDDPASLSPDARAEIAELSASFCTGLKQVMGCDGLNLGMNLGSVAGAGIADHLHQHIVPRWKGDANFMPIIGGTKVLPELIPATYGKLRAEVVRSRSEAASFKAVLFDPDWSAIYLVGDRLPDIEISADQTVWKSGVAYLAPFASSLSLIGWSGASSTTTDASDAPALAYQVTLNTEGSSWLRHVPLEEMAETLLPEDLGLVEHARRRFAPQTG